MLPRLGAAQRKNGTRPLQRRQPIYFGPILDFGLAIQCLLQTLARLVRSADSAEAAGKGKMRTRQFGRDRDGLPVAGDGTIGLVFGGRLVAE